MTQVEVWGAIAAITNVVIAFVLLVVTKWSAEAAHTSADAAVRSASAETAALEATQAALSDERERELLAQARRIAAYEIPSNHGTVFCLVNSSDQPVYEVGVALTPYGHDFNRELMSPDWFARIVVLPPGQWRVGLNQSVRGMSQVPAVELAFRDQAGRQWLRTSEGVLKGLNVDMITHFEVPMPFTPYMIVPSSADG